MLTGYIHLKLNAQIVNLYTKIQLCYLQYTSVCTGSLFVWHPHNVAGEDIKQSHKGTKNEHWLAEVANQVSGITYTIHNNKQLILEWLQIILSNWLYLDQCLHWTINITTGLCAFDHLPHNVFAHYKTWTNDTIQCSSISKTSRNASAVQSLFSNKVSTLWVKKQTNETSSKCLSQWQKKNHCEQ